MACRSEIGEAARQQGRPETTAANVSHGAQRPEPIRSIGAMARKADDPTVRQSNIEDATASWPRPKGERRAGSKGGKPGTRSFRGPKR